MIVHPHPPPPLPLTAGPLRFAAGDPTGLTSNSWRGWIEDSGDTYVACRDNFKELKVSLHASGRWRMGMTEQAAQDTSLLAAGQNRAWEVWEPPAPSPEGVVRAFQVQFLLSELAVRPHQRMSSFWASTIYLAKPPDDRVLCVTLFITPRGLLLRHESEPSVTLAQFTLPADRSLAIVAHHDPAGGYAQSLRVAKARIAMQLKDSGMAAPSEGYLYLHGKAADGARFAMPAFAPKSNPCDLKSIS